MPRLCILAAIMLAPLSVFAHPHTYLDAELGIAVGPEGVEGFAFRWAPLRNFATEVLARYDADGDGSFDPDETALVYRDAFASIAAYHFFIHVTVDGVLYRPTAVADFSVSASGGQVWYSFTVPCRIRTEDWPRAVVISVHDETSYVSFSLKGIDDGWHEAVDTFLEIIRDPAVYSHGSDFGNQYVVFTISRAAGAAAGNSSGPAVEGLVEASTLPPVPLGTFSNPFIAAGLNVDAASSGNPFFGSP